MGYLDVLLASSDDMNKVTILCSCTDNFKLPLATSALCISKASTLNRLKTFPVVARGHAENLQEPSQIAEISIFFHPCLPHSLEKLRLTTVLYCE